MLIAGMADLQVQHFGQYRYNFAEYKDNVQKHPEAAVVLKQGYRIPGNILGLVGCIPVRVHAGGTGERGTRTCELFSAMRYTY
jgi:hypothetical protein